MLPFEFDFFEGGIYFLKKKSNFFGWIIYGPTQKSKIVTKHALAQLNAFQNGMS